MLEAKLLGYYIADDVRTLPALHIQSKGLMLLVVKNPRSRQNRFEVYIGERAGLEYSSMLAGHKVMSEEQRQIPESVAKWVRAVHGAQNPPNDNYPHILNGSHEDEQPDDWRSFAQWTDKINLAESPPKEVRDVLI